MQFLSLSTGVIIGIAVGAVVLVAIVIYAIWYITTHNAIITLKNDVEESFSAMDVQMKKRYDLIPNLVATFKGYAKHESENFIRVTEARNAAIAARGSNSADGADRASAERELTMSLRTLLNFVHEQYPQLKADTQFINLTRQLEQIEEEIARSRKYYNAKVKILNNKIEKFPSSHVARKMFLPRRAYFEIEDEVERVAPKVNFD